LQNSGLPHDSRITDLFTSSGQLITTSSHGNPAFLMKAICCRALPQALHEQTASFLLCSLLMGLIPKAPNLKIASLDAALSSAHGCSSLSSLREDCPGRGYFALCSWEALHKKTASALLCCLAMGVLHFARA